MWRHYKVVNYDDNIIPFNKIKGVTRSSKISSCQKRKKKSFMLMVGIGSNCELHPVSFEGSGHFRCIPVGIGTVFA